MLKKLLKITLAILMLMAVADVSAQPFDLLVPEESVQDNLTKELRKIQAFERDMAIEKLTREPTRLQAYIELAELRRTQGRLQEAQRFYEMALEMDPKNMVANEGIAMVHYHKGEFNLAKDRIDLIHQFNPMSDRFESELATFKKNLQNELQVGVSIREDDRGLEEIVNSLEGIFPSRRFPKLTGRYRFENWTHGENGVKLSTQTFTGTFDYKADKNTQFSLSAGPENFPGGDSLSGYSVQAITGTDNLKMALRTGKTTFRENLFTVQNRLFSESVGISLFGDLHPRTRVVQSIMTEDFSDGNSRRRYDSELIHCVFRNNAPFITTNLRFYQFSFERQFDSAAAPLKYWAPSDFKGGELTMSWEKTVGPRWWWGVEGSFITSQYRFDNIQSKQESGAGATLQLGYRLSSGNLFCSFGDRLHDYFRERKLELYGSVNF